MFSTKHSMPSAPATTSPKNSIPYKIKNMSYHNSNNIRYAKNLATFYFLDFKCAVVVCPIFKHDFSTSSHYVEYITAITFTIPRYENLIFLVNTCTSVLFQVYFLKSFRFFFFSYLYFIYIFSKCNISRLTPIWLLLLTHTHLFRPIF